MVLVDEIDAHLHPEWQRRLVDLVKKHFPRVQIIATSHSALIVGALERSEIRIIRDGHWLELREDPKGKNAEDILTGAGFGMSSTRTESARDAIERYLELLAKPDQDRDSEEFVTLSKRFGELRYGTTAREERVRTAVHEALQRESPSVAKIDPAVRLLIERELGAVAVHPPQDTNIARAEPGSSDESAA